MIEAVAEKMSLVLLVIMQMEEFEERTFWSSQMEVVELAKEQVKHGPLTKVMGHEMGRQKILL